MLAAAATAGEQADTDSLSTGSSQLGSALIDLKPFLPVPDRPQRSSDLTLLEKSFPNAPPTLDA